MKVPFKSLFAGLGALLMLAAQPVFADNPPASQVVNNGREDWTFTIEDVALPVGYAYFYEQGGAASGAKELAKLSRKFMGGSFTIKAGKTYDLVIHPTDKLPSGTKGGAAIALTLGFTNKSGTLYTVNIKQSFASNYTLPKTVSFAQDYLKYLDKVFFKYSSNFPGNGTPVPGGVLSSNSAGYMKPQGPAFITLN